MVPPADVVIMTQEAMQDMTRQGAVADSVDDLRPELVEKRLGGMLVNAYPIPQLGHALQYRAYGLLW